MVRSYAPLAAADIINVALRRINRQQRLRRRYSIGRPQAFYIDGGLVKAAPRAFGGDDDIVHRAMLTCQETENKVKRSTKMLMVVR